MRSNLPTSMAFRQIRRIKKKTGFIPPLLIRKAHAMLVLKKRKLNRARRSARNAADSSVNRIKLIRKQLTKAKLNPSKLPTLLKTRINGRIRNAITLEHEIVQSFIRSDSDGRKMLLSRKPDFKVLDEQLIDIMEAMMEADKARLETAWPEKLFIEVSPGDDQAAISEKLRQIAPALPGRTVFISSG